MPLCPPRAVVVLAVVLALAAGGCGGGLADAPPATVPDTSPPPVRPLVAEVEQAAATPLPTLVSESVSRRAEQMVVRVRNINCQGLATGSGFALNSRTLLTNRHVLAGADQLEVSTWDGHTFRVSTAAVGAIVDLGVASISDGALPRAAAAYRDAHVGEPITVVGFPLGGPLTFSTGSVLDFVDGYELGVPGNVMRLTANVLPGNSGGPVLDQKGQVVGIVYAIEIATGLGLAIPLDTLFRLVDAGGFQTLPPCGYE